MTVTVEREGPAGEVVVVSINRPKVRNCVDYPTSRLLADAFTKFNSDDTAKVLILTGVGGYFCAGADLKAISEGRGNRVTFEAEKWTAAGMDDGPMGPTRMVMSKPVIAAIAGPAVAGGLELACMCDMRIVEETGYFGVYCRRWGVPLVDGGTVRLPRLIGHSRAMDMILTGRQVMADEALQMGLANRVVPEGRARAEAVAAALTICKFPQVTMLADRASAIRQWEEPTLRDALRTEYVLGREALRQAKVGATGFAGGAGRHGSFADFKVKPKM
eukprot:TRINITY_DN8714_c0_g1_i1.p1 TRINITY_DN8714_c0_g1~~TRINITY_DN8714_c0_g1_i1.p1  ORF type:complete len:305 (+),score=105.16 TRINITY_DN8714_c0_g1_i1:95-916(+)